MRAGSQITTRIWSAEGADVTRRADRLATEEPLEIRLVGGSLATTMRTPGNDFELVAGWLHAERVIRGQADIRRISYCVDRDVDEEQLFNIVNVELALNRMPDLSSLERHFYTSSACGVCGKASLESLHVCGEAPGLGPRVEAALLYSLPPKLRAAQGLFESTGGLHAAALFDASGDIVVVREDVGRHNALDKLVGWALMQGRVPLGEAIILVSGRASFEIMQKALAAGAPIVCAVSAPSSLAVDVAKDFGMTLIGFLRPGRFNIYSGPERIAMDGARD